MRITICLVSFVLVAVLGCNAREFVTTELCRSRQGSEERIRHYPEDGSASTLFLSTCRLTEINETDIVGLTNVTEIRLHNNAITTVDPAIFRSTPKLRILLLYDNQIRKLRDFPEHSCPHLDDLQLYQNKLTRINAKTLSACSCLTELYLHWNEISYIHPQAFSALTELRIIFLSTNNIAFLPDQLFVRNTKLRSLYLHENRLAYLPENFASSLKQAGGGLDRFLFHGNPWDCGCLLELLADVKSAGVSFYHGSWWNLRYYGNRTECVFSGARACHRR